MMGTVTSIDRTTGAVVIDITATSGSGTHSAWTIIGERWTGGGWQPTLPLRNLADDRLNHDARSVNTHPDSTQFACDIGLTRPINLLMMPHHRLSHHARIWWRLLSVDDDGRRTVVYDSGAARVWPRQTAFGALPWGQFAWGDQLVFGERYRPTVARVLQAMVVTTSATAATIATGDLTLVVAATAPFSQTNQVVTITSAANPDHAMSAQLISTGTGVITVRVTHTIGGGTHSDWILRTTATGGARTDYSARIAEVRIFDQANPAGHVDIGRLVVAQAYAPARNISTGYTLQTVDPSTVQRSRGGGLYADQVPHYRTVTLSIDHVERDAMLSTLYELPRIHGRTRPFAVLLDPGDAQNMHRLTIWGSLVDTNTISSTTGTLYGTELTMQEIAQE
jgi:hypothetical protein